MVISPSPSPYRTALSHEGRRNAAGSAGDLATSFWRYLPNVSCTATSRSLADLVRHIARSTRGMSWSMSGSSRRDSQSAVSLQDPVVRVEACAIRLRTEGLGFNGLWVLWYVGVRGSRDRGAAVLRYRWPSRHRNEFRVGQGGSMRDDLGDNPHRCARPAPPCRLFSRSTVRGVNSPVANERWWCRCQHGASDLNGLRSPEE